MEIILRESIDKLGQAGEVVQVKAGYARNYLLPRKLAYFATAGNLKLIEQEHNKILRHDSKLKDEAEKLLELIDGVEVSVSRKVGEHEALYGSVTIADIAAELEKKGFTIEKRKIGLTEHIKKLGEFDIPIRLFRDVVAQVKLRVEAEGEPQSESAATDPETEAEKEASEPADAG